MHWPNEGNVFLYTLNNRSHPSLWICKSGRFGEKSLATRMASKWSRRLRARGCSQMEGRLDVEMSERKFLDSTLQRFSWDRQELLRQGRHAHIIFPSSKRAQTWPPPLTNKNADHGSTTPAWSDPRQAHISGAWYLDYNPAVSTATIFSS